MTTIIAVETPQSVTIAADSRIGGGLINDGWISKIVHNGDFTFAAAGYLRAIQVLEYAHLPQPPENSDGAAEDRFVSVELVPALVEAFKSNEDSKTGSVFLAVIRGRVYEITGADGAWTRSQRGLYAVGSGSHLALGALEAGADPETAIKIASIYDSWTNDSVRVVKI